MRRLFWLSTPTLNYWKWYLIGQDIITLFQELPQAKATFATKRMNRELLNYAPPGKDSYPLQFDASGKGAGGRYSYVTDRIQAVNDFVAAGYEVDLNFAPVIYSRRHVKRGRLRRERDSAELIVEASVERGASEHLPRIGSSAI